MPRRVQTNIPLVQLPKGSGSDSQRIEISGTQVLLTDDEYNRLSANAFTGGSLTDLGPVSYLNDGVSVQGTHVNAVGALTAPVAAGSTPTKAEHDAIIADLATLRTALNAALASISGTNKAMS